jgi:AcrR family transcriptional regulator
MDDVAAAAGVAKGTLYGYFRDKEDLFFKTCTSGFDDLCELVAWTGPSDQPFRQQLLGACRQISRFADRRHQLMRMIQVEESRMSYCKGGVHDHWMAKRENLVAAVGKILANGVADGAIRSDVPIEVLANILLGMLRARAHGLAKAPPSLRRHELIVDLFCNGAAAKHSAKAGPSKLSGQQRRMSCVRS